MIQVTLSYNTIDEAIVALAKFKGGAIPTMKEAKAKQRAAKKAVEVKPAPEPIDQPIDQTERDQTTQAIVDMKDDVPRDLGKKYTEEQVRSALTVLCNSKGVETALALLAEFEVEKASELLPARRGEFVDRALQMAETIDKAAE